MENKKTVAAFAGTVPSRLAAVPGRTPARVGDRLAENKDEDQRPLRLVRDNGGVYPRPAVGSAFMAPRSRGALTRARELGLTFSELLVLETLEGMAGKETLEAWPSLSTLAQITGLSRNTVIEALKRLVKRGLIEKRHVLPGGEMPNGKGKARCIKPVYRIVVDKSDVGGQGPEIGGGSRLRTGSNLRTQSLNCTGSLNWTGPSPVIGGTPSLNLNSSDHHELLRDPSPPTPRSGPENTARDGDTRGAGPLRSPARSQVGAASGPRETEKGGCVPLAGGTQSHEGKIAAAVAPHAVDSTASAAEEAKEGGRAHAMPPSRAPERLVLERWCEVHAPRIRAEGKALHTPTRLKAVRDRLAELPLDVLLDAIDGAAISPHNAEPGRRSAEHIFGTTKRTEALATVALCSRRPQDGRSGGGSGPPHPPTSKTRLRVGSGPANGEYVTGEQANADLVRLFGRSQK